MKKYILIDFQKDHKVETNLTLNMAELKSIYNLLIEVDKDMTGYHDIAKKIKKIIKQNGE